MLDLDATKVWIHNNQADGSTGNMNDSRTKKNEVGGQDFHSDNGGDGTLMMINADKANWFDENTGEDYNYKPGEVDAEIRNLTNKDANGNRIYRGYTILYRFDKDGNAIDIPGHEGEIPYVGAPYSTYFPHGAN